MSFEQVRAAYASLAGEYVEAVGRIGHASEADRECVGAWATGLRGRVLDVGSGPGQWTDHLRRQGVRIEGVEPVPEFLSAARRSYPESRFRAGRAERLGVADASLAGVLAWYSLIHMEPETVDIALEEFARALAPGGSLLVGFFTGAELEPFEHAIATAYYWPVDLLGSRIEAAGFAVGDVRARLDPSARPVPGRRPEAMIVATRTSGGSRAR
ncbi:class I SAM-dependent methyltransferase [Leucobacter weissii]|uniref:Class I SAM-dependent methyltransferase n=1 Tax=Leucobacter weissii TaxID=1983706 RepID=A0A939MNC6_9MICO|nr:class I SAM-dependent methyltransferase [Leucobacter weissii]MBO1901747.1 class I SAM-dependent methyltransferase [Leucobacter weissii]